MLEYRLTYATIRCLNMKQGGDGWHNIGHIGLHLMAAGNHVLNHVSSASMSDLQHIGQRLGQHVFAYDFVLFSHLIPALHHEKIIS